MKVQKNKFCLIFLFVLGIAFNYHSQTQYTLILKSKNNDTIIHTYFVNKSDSTVYSILFNRMEVKNHENFDVNKIINWIPQNLAFKNSISYGWYHTLEKESFKAIGYINSLIIENKIGTYKTFINYNEYTVINIICFSSQYTDKDYSDFNAYLKKQADEQKKFIEDMVKEKKDK